MNYEIIDNFLSEKSYKKIEETISNNYFPWFLQNKINNFQKDNVFNYYFSHTFFDDEKINSNAFYIWEELLSKIKFKNLIRVKANLYPRTETILEHEKHLDYTENGITSLYYINTNNGFTNLNDKVKVSSISNRFLKFNNNTLHNSSTCTDQKYRLTVVINYIE
jgi:hypothetical protein